MTMALMPNKVDLLFFRDDAPSQQPEITNLKVIVQTD